MKPLTISCNVTVDGFMSGPDNSPEFIVADRQLEDELARKFESDADTIVVGRQTFLDMAACWPAVDSKMAAWLNNTPKLVLSTDRNLDVGAWKNSNVAVGDGVEHVRRLKKSSGGALVAFGGVRTLRSLVSANLADEYWLKVSPTIVGRGGSMFADVIERRPLTLRSTTSFPSGVLALTYAT